MKAFSRRAFKAFIIISSLVAIAWQIENWRGRRAWEAVLQETEARGQTLDWRTLIPDKVPDELNAAQHPVFDEAYWDAPSLEPYGYFLDCRPLFDRLLEGVPDQLGTDVLNESSHVTSLLGELAEAFERPHCQWFHTDEAYTDGTFPVPQIADFQSSLRRTRHLIRARTAAHLKNGNAEAARQELSVLIGFGTMMQEGALPIDQFITAASASAVVESLKPILTDPAWSPNDLSALNGQLQKLRLLDGMWQSFYREKLFTYGFLRNFSRNSDTLIGSPAFHQLLYEGLKHMPDGWLYQNLCSVHRYWDQHLLSSFNPETRRVIPPELTNPHSEQRLNHIAAYGNPRPYHILAEIVLPQIDPELWENMAITQSQWDLLAILCQLQAHKLTHGEFPPSLDSLKSLPHDYVTGKLPHYELSEDGSIALASLDWKQSGDPTTFEVRYQLP